VNHIYHCYIEAQLATVGVLRRDDMAAALGVALPTATRRIADYRRDFPGALEFEPSSKAYQPGRAFSTPTLDARQTAPAAFMAAVRTVFGNAPHNQEVSPWKPSGPLSWSR
jgi:hypothetical protein